MPRYDFRCEFCSETTEAIFPMADVPRDITCTRCDGLAHRVYQPPAAIHFRGPGFYATDVKGRVGRKRRPNPGDDLYKPHDAAAAKIARAI